MGPGYVLKVEWRRLGCSWGSQSWRSLGREVKKAEGESFGFLLPLRCLQDRTGEMIHELCAYMSPQVLLPPALCVPRGSWLEGEASARPR